MKKIFLVLCGLASLASVYAANGDTFVIDNVTYYVSNETSKTVRINSFNNAANTDSSLIIPATVVNNGTTYTVNEIYNNAFANATSLQHISLPATVSKIGTYAFQNCKFESIEIPAAVQTFSNYMFQGAAIETFINPATCYGGGRTGLFQNSALVSYSVLETPQIWVEAQEDYTSFSALQMRMFSNAKSLKTVYLSEGIKNLNYTYIFENCTALENIYMERSTPPTTGANTFASMPQGVNLYVPMASVDAYKAATNFANAKFNIIGFDYASAVRATSVLFLDEDITPLMVGATRKNDPTFYPANTTNQNLYYVSENPEIATVDAEGNVTGVAPGETLINAYTIDGSALKAFYPITVSDRQVGVDTLGEEDAMTSVFTLDGRQVYRGARQDWNAAEAGIYILRTGAKTEKVIVK